MIYLAVAGLILFAVGLRVFNTLWVYKECDYRETDSKKLWTIFTACIGFIGAVTFAFFVPKSKNKSNKKMSVASVVIFSAIIIGCVLYTCFFVIPAYNDYEIEEQSSFNYDDVTYKDENGNKSSTIKWEFHIPLMNISKAIGGMTVTEAAMLPYLMNRNVK